MTQPNPKPGIDKVYPTAMVDFQCTAEQQYAAGLEEYGTPLMTFNGRDVHQDGLEELFDAVMYFTQAKQEHEYIVNAIRTALAFLQLNNYVRAREVLLDVMEKVS